MRIPMVQNRFNSLSIPDIEKLLSERIINKYILEKFFNGKIMSSKSYNNCFVIFKYYELKLLSI